MDELNLDQDINEEEFQLEQIRLTSFRSCNRPGCKKELIRSGSLGLLKYFTESELEDGLPNIVIILIIFLTSAISNASSERSFSKLKLIKKYLRLTIPTNNHKKNQKFISYPGNIPSAICPVRHGPNISVSLLSNELQKISRREWRKAKKGQEDLKNSLEKKIDTIEEKINSVEEKIALKVEERVGAVEKKVEEEIAIVEEKIERIQEQVEEKIERIQEQVEERIKEQVKERIEGVVENFSLISQRMEDLEKKLLAGGNENKSKSVHVSAFPEPVLASPVLVTAFTGPVKLSTYDGKTSWEVYKTQFSIISEANGWTEGAKAS
ncbi:uncharacterized protein TNCV_2587921 [Trichonephila clavipes]|nr:uncharacterized protein TNCV_2587921 [Trichonephila clavipes]